MSQAERPTREDMIHREAEHWRGQFASWDDEKLVRWIRHRVNDKRLARLLGDEGKKKLLADYRNSVQQQAQD